MDIAMPPDASVQRAGGCVWSRLGGTYPLNYIVPQLPSARATACGGHHLPFLSLHDDPANWGEGPFQASRESSKDRQLSCNNPRCHTPPPLHRELLPPPRWAPIGPHVNVKGPRSPSGPGRMGPRRSSGVFELFFPGICRPGSGRNIASSTRYIHFMPRSACPSPCC